MPTLSEAAMWLVLLAQPAAQVHLVYVKHGLTPLCDQVRGHHRCFQLSGLA